MQKTAKTLENYIRSSTWVTANFCPDHAKDGKNFAYSEETKKEFRDHPEVLHKMRKEIEHSFNKFFFVFLNDSQEQEHVHNEFKKQMEERLKNDPVLMAKLIPDWRVGCRRITPGEGYLEALQADNVTASFSEIQKITDRGIQTVDGHKEFDAIVCATGFDVSFCPFWNLVGRNGWMLAEDWKDDPEAYFGVCAAGLPNYFMFNGPNCPVGHGSLLAVMEWTSEYILRWCNKIATEDIKSVSVKDKVVAEYNVYSQEFLKRTVWSGGCRSWYKNGKVDGKVTAMYAGSILHYKGEPYIVFLEPFRSLTRS
jgi:cation diffusion facilitator CzcD-associated flavoprotein CzcO